MLCTTTSPDLCSVYELSQDGVIVWDEGSVRAALSDAIARGLYVPE